MRKKFTLIELIIIIVVIGILAAMAMPKFSGVVRNAKLSAMINDKEVLEKTMVLYYQKYDKLPLLNEEQELIALDSNISLIKLVQAEEAQNNDMKTIYTSLQETLKHYNDEEESLYRIDISKVKDSFSKKLKYGKKKEDKDFYVYSTKTNNVYYYNTMLNGEGEIQHSEYNTTLKESELVDKKNSCDLNGDKTNNKPIVELITDLSNLTIDSTIKWEYTFTDEDKTPTKISFVLNDIEYDSFDKIPTQLEDDEYIIKLKMQDSKGLWSNEIVKSFIVEKNKITITQNSFSSGGYHSMKIGEDGKLYAWGRNDYGQLGIGNTTNKTTPQLVKLPDDVKIISIFLGCYHSMAIAEDGNLYAWGYNAYGQLGIGNTTNKTTPQLITLPNGEKTVSIALGYYHSMVITEKGNLYSWGYNAQGQLGIGNLIDRTTPQLVTLPNNEKPSSINVGFNQSIVKTNKGNLYSWGYNNYGQLGVGNTANQNTPQLVTLPNEEKPSSISLAAYHSMVITDKGNLYSWGYNKYGQLGIGNIENQTIPQLVTLPNGEKPISISSGFVHSMVITSNGNLYSWGNNDNGLLGIGNTTNKTTPQLVTLANEEKTISISVSNQHTLAITDKGNLYSWGYNKYGQLGIGNTINQLSPVKVNVP